MNQGKPYQPTIALDFDGVLHSYSGWNGPEPKGDPIPGALEAVRELQKTHRVIIFTTRDKDETGIWLVRNGFPPGMEVTNTKPPYLVLLDDRAVQFHGTWSPEVIEELKNFSAYWEKGIHVL